MRVFFYYFKYMRFKEELEINKDIFLTPKYYMPTIRNWVVIWNFPVFNKLIEKLGKHINEKINTIIFPFSYNIPIIFEESLKNSFDACKDIFIQNNEFVWKIVIHVSINVRDRIIFIIVSDNGAWIYATTTQDKKLDSKFIWWMWVWLIKNDYSKYEFRLKKLWDWAIFRLKDFF